MYVLLKKAKNLMIRFKKVTLQNIEYKDHLIRKNYLTKFINRFVALDLFVIENSS